MVAVVIIIFISKLLTVVSIKQTTVLRQIS